MLQNAHALSGVVNAIRELYPLLEESNWSAQIGISAMFNDRLRKMTQEEEFFRLTLGLPVSSYIRHNEITFAWEFLQ